jgi:methionyl-tRNA formyltransferase
MHGSLLPKYRGRAPVNWAVIKGETETGASLHYMTAKPDAGAVLGRQRVPILPEDTAREVFDKVTLAAELVLDASLPALIAGRASAEPQDLAQGSYYGGRRPEDGRIDWSQPARAVYNLVRAVTHPYPGAFASYQDRKLYVWETRLLPGAQPTRAVAGTILAVAPELHVQTGSVPLALTRVQFADDNEISGAAWATQHSISEGACLT